MLTDYLQFYSQSKVVKVCVCFELFRYTLKLYNSATSKFIQVMIKDHKVILLHSFFEEPLKLRFRLAVLNLSQILRLNCSYFDLKLVAYRPFRNMKKDNLQDNIGCFD